MYLYIIYILNTDKAEGGKVCPNERPEKKLVATIIHARPWCEAMVSTPIK